MGGICGDNRFEIIAKAKAELIKSTNIETSEDEMKVLDNFLFRCWQMDWLERYDKPREPLDIPTMTTDFVKEHGFPCPNDYIFKDENGNVINATKIVLEKKKTEYPKTYEECCYVLGFENTEMVFEDDYRDINPPKEQWKRLDLMNQLNKLLICRDAYWKIAGEEMGLGKPWEPDWENSEERRYSIVNIEGDINLPEKTLTKWILKVTNKILVFPTAEMRDAFYENFKELIETVKELL